MKKYRPIKLWVILLMLIIFGFLLGVFLMEGWKKILMLVCTSIIFLMFVLSITYYIQFQNDKIVIRHGLSSFNKSYRSNFKTRYILLRDINSISVNYPNKYVIINLKDGNNIMLSVNGYVKTSIIIDEFKKIDDGLGNH